jgi:hypothetical protein
MGFFKQIFRSNKQNEPLVPFITISKKIESKIDKHNSGPIQIAVYKGKINNAPIIAEVPILAKQECETLMKKSKLSEDESAFLHDNYWVNVCYKGEKHAYKGTDDIWTYSARDLAELPFLHDWIYSILEVSKPIILSNITTIRVWEDNKTIFADGFHQTLKVQLSFKPKGFILNFLLEEEFRFKEKAFYDTRINKYSFPHYFTDVQFKIVEWGMRIYNESRVKTKLG